jgi:hypothetical protein
VTFSRLGYNGFGMMSQEKKHPNIWCIKKVLVVEKLGKNKKGEGRILFQREKFLKIGVV